jgi:hypothetical protein
MDIDRAVPTFSAIEYNITGYVRVGLALETLPTFLSEAEKIALTCQCQRRPLLTRTKPTYIPVDWQNRFFWEEEALRLLLELLDDLGSSDQQASRALSMVIQSLDFLWDIPDHYTPPSDAPPMGPMLSIVWVGLEVVSWESAELLSAHPEASAEGVFHPMEATGTGNHDGLWELGALAGFLPLLRQNNAPFENMRMHLEALWWEFYPPVESSATESLE